MDEETRSAFQRMDRYFGLIQQELERSGLRQERLEAALGSLQVEMRDGFRAVDERFNVVDERFNAVDERFNAVDERFNAVEERFIQSMSRGARSHFGCSTSRCEWKMR